MSEELKRLLALPIPCNIIELSDGYNIALPGYSGDRMCGEHAVAVGVWCHGIAMTKRYFVYLCIDHLERMMEIPYDGHHQTWFEYRGRILQPVAPDLAKLFGGLITEWAKRLITKR